jgi:Tfp pilus assembly protein PilF
MSGNMSASRINLLEQYYKDDPNDPFNLYALALEYLHTDELKSKLFFDKLLKEQPDYVPTYYHAAKLYQQLNDIPTAQSIYQKGIAVAKEKNDAKALRELQSAYNEMMFE